jgi:tRNA-dihydrouridine synthase 3
MYRIPLAQRRLEQSKVFPFIPQKLFERFARFLIAVATPQPVTDDDAAEGSTTGDRGQKRDARDAKYSRGGGGRGGKMTKEQKKAQRGQNKARKFGKVRDDFDLCWKIANGSVCEFGEELRVFKIIQLVEYLHFFDVE